LVLLEQMMATGETNQEINEIIKGQNIIRFTKKQRLNWLGHVERMAEDNIVQKIKRWKPILCVSDRASL